MKKETIVANTMREFKEGKLRSSSGDKVTDRNQAIAIALSKSGQSKYSKGGYVVQYDPEKKKTITRTKKEADDFVEVLKKNGHTLIEVFKVGEKSKSKSPASKTDGSDIDDALTGAKTLLKFASASDKKEIETFIKGLEILKKMSGESKTHKTEKMKTMSLSKDRDYVKEAKEYFIDAGFIDELDTDERFYVNELIKGLSTPYRSKTEIEANQYFIENEMADQLTKDKQFYVVKLIENSKKKPLAPAPKKNTPEKDSLKEAKVYFKQEFDTTPKEDDLIKALLNSDKSKFRTEKELEAEKYFSKTKFEDEFDNHIKTLIEYSKKKPSKDSKSKYTLDEAKKFFIESGKIDEVSPDTERLIRALIDQDKSPIRTEDELYAEKSLLPNITNWSDDWKYHITNLISLSKNKKGEMPKSEKRYTYALTSRPFDIGTYPKENFVRFVYEEQDNYKFGLLEYSEPIPDKDLKHYSLAPVSELNQYNEKLFEYFDGNIGQAFIKKTPGNIPYVKVDLYDDPNEEAIETIDLSGYEFLSKIKSGDYKILENQSKLKDTDGENHLKKKRNLKSIKKEIIDFVEKNSWFELDDDSDDTLLFATRENGNVGSESPGSKDIAEAKRLKQEIEKKFEGLVKIQLEVVDEWVHINIDVLPLQFAKGGVIGQEIVFDDNGEENKGVIKDIHEITGDYIVATDDGRTVLASKELDVISLGNIRKKPMGSVRKRFSFFKDGGLIDYKKKQLDIINRTNPAPNNVNTWIRSVDDIKTAEEVFSVAFEEGAMYPDFQIEDMQEALDTGFVTIYSSYPIKSGVFVTPSAMNATDYAGGNRDKIHSKKVKLNEIAWIDESEGQYAPVNRFDNGGSIPKTETILWAVKIGEPDWKEQIITTDPNLIEPAKKWAMANGFDRFRIVGIDMSSKPDFTKTFAKGGYVRPGFDIKTTGVYLFKSKEGEFYVMSYLFERENDTEDSLEIQSNLRPQYGSILIQNSAWKRLSDGKTIKARTSRGDLTGTLTRIDDIKNSDKYIKGDYDEYVEEYDETPEYKIVEGFDFYTNKFLYRVTDGEDYIGEWHTKESDAQKELAELKSKFKNGGNVRGMDWYQMWQPKRNKVVKVGDVVLHKHSKQPYKVIELLDDQYTVAKMDGNKEIEWKTFYEDFEDHNMFVA